MKEGREKGQGSRETAGKKDSRESKRKGQRKIRGKERG